MGCWGKGFIIVSIISLIGSCAALGEGDTAGFFSALFFAALTGLPPLIIQRIRKANQQAEEERIRQERERRRRTAIETARNDPQRFEVDTAYNTQGIASTARRNDFDGWLRILQSRVQYFEDKNDGATGLINEEIAAFEAMQQEAKSQVMPAYEAIIDPYRDDLAGLPEVQQSARLHADYDIQIPAALDPAAFKRQTQQIWNDAGRHASVALRSSQTLGSGGAAAGAGAAILIGMLRAYQARVKQRTEFERFQAEIDVFARETMTTLLACEAVHRHVVGLKAMHEEAGKNTRDGIEYVRAAIDERARTGQNYGSFYDFPPHQQEALEQLYIEGERLKQLAAVRAL